MIHCLTRPDSLLLNSGLCQTWRLRLDNCWRQFLGDCVTEHLYVFGCILVYLPGPAGPDDASLPFAYCLCVLGPGARSEGEQIGVCGQEGELFGSGGAVFGVTVSPPQRYRHRQRRPRRAAMSRGSFSAAGLLAAGRVLPAHRRARAAKPERNCEVWRINHAHNSA